MENNTDNYANLNILLLKIRNKYPSLTNAAKRIAEYILENYSEAVYLNITELANKTMVAESTVTKFVRAIGYDSFHDLKLSLARITAVSEEKDSWCGDINLDENIEDICRGVFYNDIEDLENSFRLIDPSQIEAAAIKILKARKIDVYAMGSSTIASQNARLRFYRLGIQCYDYSDPHQQLISASLLTKNDLAIGVSNSGKSINVVDALRVAKESGASTVCITNFDDSPIVKYADIKLFTSTRDSEQINESLSARIAEIALIDAVYVAVASKMKKQALQYFKATTDVIDKSRIK